MLLVTMSDLMYNEIGVNGKPFEKGKTWREIAVHDENNIKGFFGDFGFLSNFLLSPVLYEGVIYPSSECAYQSSKVVSDQRYKFQTCTASQSKKLWKSCEPLYDSPEEWDSRKYEIMAEIVMDKFRRNPELRQKLLNTGDKYLEETNWWMDQTWGVCNGVGSNKLGIILMTTRAYFKTLEKNK